RENQVLFQIEIKTQPIVNQKMSKFTDSLEATHPQFAKLSTSERIFGQQAFCKYKIIPYYESEGGEASRGNNPGGLSLYMEKNEDFNRILPHSRDGIFSRDGISPNTCNAIQFHLCCCKSLWLFGFHLNFSSVKGPFHIVQLNKRSNRQSKQTTHRITICRCKKME
uniref:PPIase cyclophilin-type domain-containing protein n=1 Tax=Macaca mulatta TaxID=9544 RepID=A0A5F8AF49_MACMU